MLFNTGRLCSQCWPSLFSQPTSISRMCRVRFPRTLVSSLSTSSRTCLRSFQHEPEKNKQQMTIKLIFMNSTVHHPSFNIFFCVAVAVMFLKCFVQSGWMWDRFTMCYVRTMCNQKSVTPGGMRHWFGRRAFASTSFYFKLKSLACDFFDALALDSWL